MNALIVTHGFPPHGVAGVERVAEQTARELAARGHTVSVLTRRPSPAPPTLRIEQERRGDVEIHTVSGGGSAFGRFPRYETAMERVFERTLAAVAPDVVLVSHLLHHSPLYVDVARRWGIPVVLELHDFFVACPLAHLRRTSGEACDGPEGGAACAHTCFASQDGAEARWALRFQEFRRALEHADVILAPSRYVADYFERWSGGRVAPRVLANGIVVRPMVAPRVRRRSGALSLASIGVVIEHKGQHVVVDAIRAAGLTDVRYTLLGLPVPDYTQELVRAADRVEGLDLRVHGEFFPEELPRLLEEVDAVVVGSIVPESFSIVAREAFACGIPVVAPAQAGLLEAVRDGDNGLHYQPGDVLGLAARLRSLQEDPELLDRLAAGIRPGDWISSEQRTEALVELLEELRSRPPASRPPRADDWSARTLRAVLS